jgi:hypothetical protein
MFTQPSVNQIASTYQPNAAPLARKVDQDKKQNGGIPKDLRQLMALNDIAEGKEAMGIQQALQIPTNMPTVAQTTQQLAQQALQARMLQQVREQQRLQQKPPTLPLGTPQPEEQPQGLDALSANVGEAYAEGGIIGFDGTKTSSVQDPEEKKEEKATSAAGDFMRAIASALSGGVQRTMDYGKLKEEKEGLEGGLLNAFRAYTPTQKAERQKRAELLGKQMSEVGEKGEIAPTYPKAGSPTFKTYAADSRPNASEEALAAETSKLFNLAATPGAEAVSPTKVNAPRPSATQGTQGTNRVNADSAPMPAGLQGLASSLATPGLDYQRKQLNQDENAIAAAKRALYDKEVGARDLSIYDRTAAELEARKQKLNAPKAGYDAMMEYLEQIAIGGGRTSAESGSLGASRQRALQKERLSQQDTLMDKILELGAKKSEAQFAERKGMFDLTQAEKDRVIKEKSDAAKQLGLSEDETRKLIEQGLQKELDRKNELKKAGISASAGNRDDLLGRALLIKKDNPTISIEEAIKRAAVATYAGQTAVAEGKNDAATEKAVAAIRAKYAGTMKFLSPDSPLFKRQAVMMEKDIADARGTGGAGLPSAVTSPSTGKVKFVGYE